jgi:hypothetical protein
MTAWRSCLPIWAIADESDSAVVVVIFSLVGFAVTIGMLASLPADMATAVLDALSR